ncbi:MAG: ribbon-helix-helix domain-containing protein [Patescibacteria group bacterium]|nr:ribbon-helix-helix domain-containing protein [Patescibacteria group bacterium]
MVLKTVNISFTEQTLDEIDKFAKKEALSRSDVLRIGAKKYIRSKSNWENISRWGKRFAKGKKIDADKIDKAIAERRYGEK